jgi:hypothetical protein
LASVRLSRSSSASSWWTFLSAQYLNCSFQKPGVTGDPAGLLQLGCLFAASSENFPAALQLSRVGVWFVDSDLELAAQDNAIIREGEPRGPAGTGSSEEEAGAVTGRSGMA